MVISDDEHKNVFSEIFTIGFKNNKNLWGYLVRAVLLKEDEVGRFKPCGGKRTCQLCSNMNDKCSFKSKHFDKIKFS